MTRITMLAVLAGVIAVIVGGLVLSSGRSGPTPAPSVAPSPVASATPSFTPGPIPATINGGWTAVSRGTAIEDTDTTTIAFGPSVPNFFAVRATGGVALAG